MTSPPLPTDDEVDEANYGWKGDKRKQSLWSQDIHSNGTQHNATKAFVAIIVSRFQMRRRVFSSQMFIVRFLIISNTKNHHIYTQMERRGKGLAAGETEREREIV